MLTVLLSLSPFMAVAIPPYTDQPYCPECCPCMEGGQSTFVCGTGVVEDQFPIVSLKSPHGNTVGLELHYSTQKAAFDVASTVNEPLGYGWTHSYNKFLFRRQGMMMRYDGKAISAQFLRVPGPPPYRYNSTAGYFETMQAHADGSFSITDKHGRVETFRNTPGSPYSCLGPVWQLTECREPNGRRLSLHYDARGRLTNLTDTFGRSLRFTYDAADRLATIVDPKNRTSRFEHNAAGTALQRIIDPAGRATSFEYDPHYRLTMKVDRDGRRTRHLYGDGFLAGEVQRPDGSWERKLTLINETGWLLNEAESSRTMMKTYFPGRITRIDGNGRRWTIDYDHHGYTTRRIAPDGWGTAYEHDHSSHRWLSSADANGIVTHYQQDDRGNRTNQVDALGNVTSWIYEPVYNRMTSMTDPNGRKTSWQYDDRGNRTNEIDPLLQTRSWTFDTNGNLLTERDKNGNVTRHEYDTEGNRTRTIDALNQVPQFAYDAVGNLIRRTDANLHVSTYEYDQLDRLVSETRGLSEAPSQPGPGGGTSPAFGLSVGPADHGRLVVRWNATPGLTLTRADAVTGPYQPVEQDGQPVTTSPFFLPELSTNRSAFFRLSGPPGLFWNGPAVAGGRGAGLAGGWGGADPAPDPGNDVSTTVHAYDNEGNRTNSTDCATRSTSYRYDHRQRLASVTDALGYSTSYGYDTNNNRIAVTNENGFVTRYEYDAQNRLIRTTDALNCVRERTYDPAGNLLTETDANQNTRHHGYDVLHRRIATTNALGGVTRFEYAVAGPAACCNPTLGSSLVTRETDANGRVTYFKYDELDRLKQVIRKQGDVADAIHTGDAVTSHTYDPNGNVVASTLRIDATTYLTNRYAYDALNRPIATTNPAGESTVTAYDPVGNVFTISTCLTTTSVTGQPGGTIETESPPTIGITLTTGLPVSHIPTIPSPAASSAPTTRQATSSWNRT